jgi:hypothetical protein
MNLAKEKYYRTLFGVSAIYDIVLGVAFIFFREQVFTALGIGEKLPAVSGYLALLGAFVLVIGIAYCLIARGDLQRNSDLILIGALYKLAYSATAFYYWGLPHVIFSALFGVADGIFFILMAECWLSSRKPQRA